MGGDGGGSIGAIVEGGDRVGVASFLRKLPCPIGLGSSYGFSPTYCDATTKSQSLLLSWMEVCQTINKPWTKNQQVVGPQYKL